MSVWEKLCAALIFIIVIVIVGRGKECDMPFDKNVPVNYTAADADEVRSNLVALAVHHKGPTAPDAPELGYIWLDDALSDNWKLKAYTKNGEAAAVWVSLFDHMESTPVPSSGGGGVAVVDFVFDFPADDSIYEFDAGVQFKGVAAVTYWGEAIGGGPLVGFFNGQLRIGDTPDLFPHEYNGVQRNNKVVVASMNSNGVLLAANGEGATELETNVGSISSLPQSVAVVASIGSDFEVTTAIAETLSAPPVYKYSIPSPIVRSGGWPAGSAAQQIEAMSSTDVFRVQTDANGKLYYMRHAAASAVRWHMRMLVLKP